MANSHTQLYASQGNGGKATVTVGELGSAISVPAATTTAAGTVLQAADVSALTSVGPGVVANTIVDVTGTPTQATINANFATLATKVNGITAALKAAGIMA